MPELTKEARDALGDLIWARAESESYIWGNYPWRNYPGKEYERILAFFKRLEIYPMTAPTIGSNCMLNQNLTATRKWLVACLAELNSRPLQGGYLPYHIERIVRALLSGDRAQTEKVAGALQSHLEPLGIAIQWSSEGSAFELAPLSNLPHSPELVTLTPEPPGGLTSVSDTRLDELRAISSSQFGLQKLIRLCEELNIAYKEGCYLATIMLTRALMDHIPPIFRCGTFAEVVSKRPAHSTRETMGQLDKMARKIADTHLHLQIQRVEPLPVAQQVNFSQGLDVLLQEIIRELQS